jgi:hypothetical protein
MAEKPKRPLFRENQLTIELLAVEHEVCRRAERIVEALRYAPDGRVQCAARVRREKSPQWVFPKKFGRRSGCVFGVLPVYLLFDGSQRQVERRRSRGQFEMTRDRDCRWLEEHVPDARVLIRATGLREGKTGSANDYGYQTA